MNYRLTHYLFQLRKLVRKESRPGNLKKMMIAMLLSFLVISTCRIIPTLHQQEKILLLKSFFYLRGTINPPDNVVIINIDDNTYKELGLSTRKPFPRNIFAQTLQNIQTDKPKLIILDTVVLKEDGEEDATEMYANALKLGPSTIGKAPTMIDSTFDKSSYYLSDPKIRDAAKFELPMELDYSYGISMFIMRNRQSNNLIQEESFPLLKPIQTYVSKNSSAPQRNDLINFYGPPNTIPNYSLWKLFSNKKLIPKGYFKDKVVLLGFKSDLRGRGHSDKEVLNVPVPGGKMYGVEIHANIVGNLIENSWIKRLSNKTEAVILLLLLFFLIKGVLLYQPLFGLIYLITYLCIWFGTSYIAFSRFNYFIPGFFTALLSMPIIFGGVSCTVATHALKELRETKKMLGL